MLCVQVQVDGTIQSVHPPPADYSTCALVIPSGAHASASPFVMTREEGIQIGLAISTIWVIVGLIMKTARRI